MLQVIYRNWSKVGIFIAACILVYVYIIQGNNISLLEKFAFLNLAFLMLHQFEENVYPGGFMDFFNYKLYNPLGFLRNKLTDKAVIWVNVILGWGMNVVVLLFFSYNAIAVMIVILILFINGILHFSLLYKTQYYNPGAVTGALLFIPLGFYSYYKLSGAGLINITDLPVIIIFALLGSTLIPITIYLCRNKQRR